MNYFTHNDRLGIHIPTLERDWHEYSEDIQLTILLQWEKVRGFIPDNIKKLEQKIMALQSLLINEMDFNRSCILNSQISELASIINDLWIWFRMHEILPEKVKVFT